MNKKEMQEMLQRIVAKAKATPATAAALTKAADELVEEMDKKKVEVVSLKELGITDESLKTEEGREEAEDILKEVVETKSNKSSDSVLQSVPATSTKEKDLGVAKDVELNKNQAAFRDLVLTGKSCVMVGAAGTGKTTTMRQVTRALIDSHTLQKVDTATKWVSIGTPGMVILSFTRKAVNNIRRAVVDELKSNTLTCHKLLEFEPEFYEIEDPARPGFYKNTMRFIPTRTRENPLPPCITRVAFEESSMIGIDLYNLLMDAMPHTHQDIFLGDIQQLPPVFGAAVLGFKMLELPVVELTEIYRQARDSPILDVAWKLLEGNPHVFSSKSVSTKVFNEHVKKEVSRISIPALDILSRQQIDPVSGKVIGELKFQVWQKQLSNDHALITAIKQFNMWHNQGYYNPDDDIILCPFNKAFGTIEINKGIQQYLGRLRSAEVCEVVAGFEKHYLAIGDRVLFDKEDAFITNITRNGQYLGKNPATPSKNLDRWGHYQEEITESEEANHAAETDMSPDDLELVMQNAASSNEDRVQAASHIITIRFAYTNETAMLETAGEINNLLGGNAVTFHKFQGSECRRVFIVLHTSHATMNSRELLYTGVTRAKEFIHIICEPTTFEKGIKSQRIKGNTLAEKAEFFKGKQDGTVPVRSRNLTVVVPRLEIDKIVQKSEAIPVSVSIQDRTAAGIKSNEEIVAHAIHMSAQERLAALKAKLASQKRR